MIAPAPMFKLLADDTRLNAVLLLHTEGELCVCEMVEALEETQPKVSRHLAQLRTSGLLNAERRGQWIFYSLSRNLPDWLLQVIESAVQGKPEEIAKLKNNLERMREGTTSCAS